MKQKLLVLVGPTASGKSALAVQLAKRFRGEIISADSRQVYRGLDIGTGKITKTEMQGISHHLLDVASPKRRFSADDFVKQARKTVDSIGKSDKLPIIAGGTGFYIDSLVGRIELGSTKPDVALRKKLSRKTAPQLFTILRKKDSLRAEMMDTPSERNNKIRLIRAIEIAAQRTAGHSKSEGRSSAGIQTKVGPSYDLLWIGIVPEMDLLDTKIRKRLEDRLRHGMIAEARRLHANGLSYKRMEELGLEYRYLALFLQRKISREELGSRLYSAIRRYARKQVGYWKRNTEIQWFTPSSTAAIDRLVGEWIKK